jgi:hypothetical protein
MKKLSNKLIEYQNVKNVLHTLKEKEGENSHD